MKESTHEYRPRGVCSKIIHFRITTEGKISGLCFDDGCDGNARGLAVLLEGMDAGEAARRLKGIRCGRRKTSCPDQLALAINDALVAGGQGDPEQSSGK